MAFVYQDRDKLSGSSNVLINHDGAVVDHFPAFIPRGKSFQILDQLHKGIHQLFR